MRVREYSDEDFETIRKLHEQSGFDYRMPPLSSQEFFSRRVVEDNSGFGMGAFMRLTAEAYLVCNPEWRTPAWRFEALRQLCHVCNDDARNRDVKEVGAFLPPQAEVKFGKRLIKMGWGMCREDWHYYYKGVS